MKKQFTLLLAGLMLLSLMMGCGPTDQNAAPDVSPNAGNALSSPTATTTAPSVKPALSGVVKTGGSTSVEKVMLALIFQFQEENNNVTVNYEMNGSGDGIKNTISGMYEIGHSSRELKTDGTEDGLDATAYAIDGIAVIVNKANSVTNLTKAQIKDILTGAVTNWKDVGGADAPITVVTRESGSGTRGAVAELIGLEKKDDESTAIAAAATVADSTGAVQTTVSQNPNAIGYMSFSDVDTGKVKPVQYEGVDISTDSIQSGTYKLKRDFFLITKTGAALSPEAQAFIDFILSSEGQEIVAGNKLLPVK